MHWACIQRRNLSMFYYSAPLMDLKEIRAGRYNSAVKTAEILMYCFHHGSCSSNISRWWGHCWTICKSMSFLEICFMEIFGLQDFWRHWWSALTFTGFSFTARAKKAIWLFYPENGFKIEFPGKSIRSWPTAMVQYEMPIIIRWRYGGSPATSLLLPALSKWNKLVLF